LIPQGAPMLDHPLVEFAWSTGKQQALVKGFRDWLFEAAGRQALGEAGLGPVRRDCSLLEDNPCAPAMLGTARDLFLQAQKPGRVLLALDTSGSMTAAAGPAGTTRFTLASRAISQALGQMGSKDQFGLWTFAGAGRAGHQQLVAIAEGDQKHRAEIVAALGRVRLAGDTPLYDTIIAGMEEIAKPAADVEPRALVVLTDGVDTSSADSATTMQARVRDLAGTAGVRLFVVATGEASCTGPRGLREVATIGLGGCFDADPDQLGDAIAHLFEVLWKGQ
jgi:Mg-chelatase subunit ChlD